MAAEDKINNYTLGRGELHFGQFRAGTTIPRPERYLGNSPELSYSASVETLDHYNSDRGIRVKDASVTLQQDYAGALSLDSIDGPNLAYFFLGDVITLTTAERTVVGETLVGAELGATFQLGTSAADPAGVRKITTVTVANATTAANVPVAGVDYLIDAERGRLTVQEGSTKIVKGDNLTVGYKVEESTREQVVSKGMTIEGALRYIANNPAGKAIDFYMPYVKLTPNGDFNIKGDDWQVLAFNIEIVKKGSLSAIYADGVAYDPAA